MGAILELHWNYIAAIYELYMYDLYIGVGANLKPVNIYTERPTHMNSTTYHAKT